MNKQKSRKVQKNESGNKNPKPKSKDCGRHIHNFLSRLIVLRKRIIRFQLKCQLFDMDCLPNYKNRNNNSKKWEKAREVNGKQAKVVKKGLHTFIRFLCAGNNRNTHQHKPTHTHIHTQLHKVKTTKYVLLLNKL